MTDYLLKITQYKPYIVSYATTSRNGIINLGIWLYVQILLMSLCTWIMIDFLWGSYVWSFMGMLLGSFLYIRFQRFYLYLMHSENYPLMLLFQVFFFFLLSLILSLFLTYMIFDTEIQLELLKMYAEKPVVYGFYKIRIYFLGLIKLLQDTSLFFLIFPQFTVIFFILVYPSFFIYWNQNNLYHRILRNYEQYKQSIKRNK